MALPLHFAPRLFALLIGLLVATPSQAQDWQVRMYKPAKVGDVYAIDASGESTTTTSLSIDGGKPKDSQQQVTIKISGTVEVMAIDAAAQASKLRCTLKSCLMDDKPVLADGAVVVADNNKGHVEFTLKGAKVSVPVAKALALVLHPHDPEEDASADEIAGDNQPRQPGDSWPVNTAAVANRLKTQGITADPKSLGGSVSLATKVQDGHEVMVMESDETGTGLEATLKNGVMMENGTFKVHTTVATPPDGGFPKTDVFTSERTYRETGVTPDKKGFIAEVTVKRSGSKTVREAKEAGIGK